MLAEGSNPTVKLNLTYAGALYDRTLGLYDGTIALEGISLNYVQMSHWELFRRQARHAEFDVSEFSLSTYVLLHVRGDRRMVALPVFPSRVFRHSSIFVNVGAGIREPKDLVGKRMGTMEYQQTAGLWARGMLQDEYGVPADQMEWYFGGYDEPENYVERVPVKLPNLRTRTISNRQCLDQMLVEGEIDALMGAVPPRSFRTGSPNVRRLFPNPREVELDYYRRTGLFPIMHLVVVKREIYERAPWVAVSLCKAFARAKTAGMQWLSVAGALRCSLPWLPLELEEQRATMGDDVFPYGLEPNRAHLETFLRYSQEQGLIDQRPALEELFAPETHGEVLMTEY
ncbi:MAG: ABC transporter substrate-binding protein [Chloroflexi bacterium]|nr:ABC transporter substrate-binding protein [Chloroflexota bacterium]